MDSLIPILLIILIIFILVRIIKWCIDDARLRGKSPIFVVIAVMIFFPWGWIAWLIFRPQPQRLDPQLFDPRQIRKNYKI